MTRPRRELVSLDATPWYHCVSRCVRRAFLCGEDHASGNNFEHRRAWIRERITALAEIFAIEVAAYAVMSNHYHLVLRIDRDLAQSWNTHTVIERWYRLHSGHALADRFLAGEPLSLAERNALDTLVETWRERLFDLGWFMRSINEHIARLANAEDGCTGRFWEGRFKSQALMDEAAVLACMAYVDLNPVRAGITDTPEDPEQFTSLAERVNATRAEIADAIPNGPAPNLPVPHPEHLVPFTNPHLNRGATSTEPDTAAALPFDFLDYLALVDWSGRAVRDDKRGAIPEHLAPILLRVGIEPAHWLDAITGFEQHFHRALGPAEQLRNLADALGRNWLQGISRCLRFYRTAPA